MTEPRQEVAPPSGHPPPVEQALPDGTNFDLRALAATICERYTAEFPDEQGRYGEAGMAWCKHDNQHILNWAVMSERALADLDKELAWLARVLEARDFPLERLARDLELAAEVVIEQVPGPGAAAVAQRLIDGAGLIRSRRTFLDA